MTAHFEPIELVVPARMRVLVVDDHTAVREGIARLVRGAFGAGADVSTASSVLGAMQEIRLRPDVVLLDIDLAGEDGLSVMPFLLPTCRVMVLTSHGDAATRERALKSGAHMFIEKGAPASMLLARLEQLIRSVPPGLKGEHSPTSPGAFNGAELGGSSVAPSVESGHSPTR